MPYTHEKPPQAETADQLRARIPGWGADLDPSVRPSMPRRRLDPEATGAHWYRPEQQPQLVPRERSIEHADMTAVFGTTCPPRGAAGVLRRFSYRRFSEARAAHWILLLVADRVDAWAHHARSIVMLRPDNPITQTGVLAERHLHPIGSRRGARADIRHQWIDPLLVVGPWLVLAIGSVPAARRVHRRRRARWARRHGPISARPRRARHHRG